MTDHLRPIEGDEYRVIRAWRNHESIRKWMYNQHVISEEEHDAWWNKVSTSPKHRYLFYVKAGQALGVVGFTDILSEHKTAFWAFYSAPDAPKGTGSRMEELALEYAFNTLSLEKLSCEVISTNTRVVALHRRFGFVEEGCFRSHIEIDGVRQDVVRLAIFKDRTPTSD